MWGFIFWVLWHWKPDTVDNLMQLHSHLLERKKWWILKSKLQKISSKLADICKSNIGLLLCLFLSRFTDKIYSLCNFISTTVFKVIFFLENEDIQKLHFSLGCMPTDKTLVLFIYNNYSIRGQRNKSFYINLMFWYR